MHLKETSAFTMEDLENVPKIFENQEVNGREELKIITITREKVLRKLLGLKVDKSSAPDGLRPQV